MTRADLRDQGRTRLLGDRIDAALQATGIKAVVRAAERRTGLDCGCARRTAALNAWDARRRGG